MQDMQIREAEKFPCSSSIIERQALTNQNSRTLMLYDKCNINCITHILISQCPHKRSVQFQNEFIHSV